MTRPIYLPTRGPHDFYMALDSNEYFEQEYSAEEIVEWGFARPLRLEQRDVLVVAHFIEDAPEPHFELTVPDQDQPNAREEEQIKTCMSRILGCNIDTRASAEALASDPVLSPLFEQHQGFKRISRADFYEDAMRLIIRTRISHNATKQRMVRDVRERWGEAFDFHGTTYFSYPRPEILAEATPEELRDMGLSTRKGEYVTGLARAIVEGDLDLDALENMPSQEFYDTAVKLRGIGPSSAQFLVLRRDRSDAIFPLEKSKSGALKNPLLGWILPAYDLSLETSSESEIQAVLDRWSGHEATAAHYFYYGWLMKELEKRHGGQ